MRRAPFLPSLLACLLLPACKSPSPSPAEPLTWGDAEWPEAPIPQPGGNGNDDDGGGGDGDGGSAGSFVPSSGDLSSASQCDPFAQDCPEGEKCVAYASTGGQFDANKCVPVMGSGAHGEICTYAGKVDATDDCDAVSYCWDVTDTFEGACAQFCQGTPDDPLCPDGHECLIAFEGSINLCVDNSGDETGTDTGTDSGSEGGLPNIEEPESPDQTIEGELEQVCPDTTEPIVLYMSNDDSNSQASPVIARQLINEGRWVRPNEVRIHEFLNYYQIATDNPEDKPAELGMQMRRTNAVDAEFTLLLTAKGQVLRQDQRPPMNLVFSLDTSGSMNGLPLELVKDSMTALAGSLRVGDVISLVEWSSSTEVLLESHAVTGPNDPTLIGAIEALDTGGSTDLHGGLVKAYELAEAAYLAGGINRVILMSDGGANTGVTDIELIAEAASAEDGTGIYMVGVGVAPASGYRDDLMDQVTDAGKGAYVFIDDPAEAELQFNERFLSNVAVAARNVQMRVTLPWYFGVKSFHGEEFSADPAEVEPQHLAPNDAMAFHQIISACDPNSVSANDTIEAHIEYLHPLTLEPMSETQQVAIGALVKADAAQLYKADVVVGFAKSLIVIGARMQDNNLAGAVEVAEGMAIWLDQAAQTLDDDEVADMATLMAHYAVSLGQLN